MKGVLLAVALAFCQLSAAQGQDPRLLARLPPGTRTAVVALIDRARADHLPTEPLVRKALEGVSKDAASDRIIMAVQSLADRLGSARSTLGADASESDLVSAAAALYAGVEPETLLRVVRPPGGASTARRLVVLVDLIQLGVAQDTAVGLIVDLVSAGVSDNEYVMLRDLVGDDVRRGALPGAASVTRVRGLLVGRPRDLDRSAPPIRQ